MKQFFQKHSVMIARILFLACLVFSVIKVITWINSLEEIPSPEEINEAIAWGVVLPVVFSFLAMLIITQQPGNRVGWLLMLIAASSINPANFIASFLDTPPEQLTPGLWLVLWADAWSWVPAIFPLFLIPLHFPTGQPPSPRWNWVNRLAAGMWLFFIVFIAFGDEIGPLNFSWTMPNPIGLYSFEDINTPFQIIWTAGLFILLLAGVAALFVRYRLSSENVRLQIKWLLYAVVFFAVVYVITGINSNSPPISILNFLFPFSVLLIPTAIAIAILRYKLYDIDLIIRRTLVYSLLSALLGLVYFGSVALAQGLLTTNRGPQTEVSGQPSAVVIVVTTLVIAALFNPLRRRLQDLIDRRFYRQKYDAEKALANFNSHARINTELQDLSTKLIEVVSETLQPNTIDLWLKPGNSQTKQEKF